MSEVRPIIRVLTPEQIIQVHEYSLKILSRIGLRVDSAQARNIFARAAGCSRKDNIVHISPELVEWALKAAPAIVDIYDRSGRLVFRLGDSQNSKTRFGIGVTNLYYQEPMTDEVIHFSRKHMAISSALGNALPSFDVVSTIGIVQDYPPEVSDLYGTLEMAANTTKPLVILVSEPRCFRPVLNLLEHLKGNLSARPFAIPYFNPITPLVLNGATADKIFITIERGLPFIYSNYSMSGATTPITPAGTLALLTAELLGGLVFSQLVKEGTPVILGSLPAAFEMRSMGNLYTPTSLVLNLACAEMMAHYGLPHAGASGSGSGWSADLPASGTLWINHLTGCLGRVGLAPFVGGNLGSLVFSPLLVVYANELIRQARLFGRGFSLDDASVALNEIESIGPGGNFLAADLTVKLCRQDNYDNSIWQHLTFDQWLAQGRPKAEDVLRRHTRDLLDNLRVPEDHDDLIAAGEAFIEKVAI
jgi:trimethylamine--corrinoid protein Co-methyltransferase